MEIAILQCLTLQSGSRYSINTLVQYFIVTVGTISALNFMGFGDSSLDFKLYVYAQQLGDRFPLMHAIHEAILKALREHDIQIPFPQRDLHILTTTEDKNE